MRERKCDRCPLSKQCRGPVWGKGDPYAQLWFVGEAPGKDEDLQGIPFCGKAGVEDDQTYRRRAGLRDTPSFTTNVVKCRPPKNRDPKPEEIDACSPWLEEQLAQAPDDLVIVTLGRFATAWFLGEADMDRMHGIPFRHPKNPGWIIVPAYHPAVGLYDGKWMTQIMQDYQMAGDVVRGTVRPEDWRDDVERHYQEAHTCPDLPPGLKLVGVDTESVRGVLYSIQVAIAPGVSYYIPADSLGTRWVKALLENPEVKVVLHNAMHDLPKLAQAGIHPPNWVDTLLMAHLLGDLPRGLKSLAFRLCGMRMTQYSELVLPLNKAKILPYLHDVAAGDWPNPEPVMVIEGGKKRFKKPWPLHRRVRRILADLEKGKNVDPYQRWMDQPDRKLAEQVMGPYEYATLADVEPQARLDYACADADGTLRIYYKLMPRIHAEGLLESLERDQGVVPMIVDMIQAGVDVDRERLGNLKTKYTGEMVDLIEEIAERVGCYVNPGSAKQVGELLYRRLHLKAEKHTKLGAPSTSHEVLEKMRDRHPVVPRILRYREVDKLRGSFVERLLEKSEYGRVRDDFSLIRTATGRLSASILMTIPVRSEEGRELRKCFVASPGNVLLSGDYSQIELRVMAHISEDPLMLDIFRRGDDIHTMTAAALFGLKVEEVDKYRHRYPAKTVNFGIAYGLSADGLHRDMAPHGWTKDRCEEFIDEWYDLYPGVQEMMKDFWTQARRYGWVTSLLGRRRLIPQVRSAHYWVREKGLREAGNMPIQGGAQEIMKEAMRALTPLYVAWNKKFYITPLIQIHDDIIWEVARSKANWAAARIKATMETAVKLRVPLIVEMQRGLNWGELEGI